MRYQSYVDGELIEWRPTGRIGFRETKSAYDMGYAIKAGGPIYGRSHRAAELDRIELEALRHRRLRAQADELQRIERERRAAVQQADRLRAAKLARAETDRLERAIVSGVKSMRLAGGLGSLDPTVLVGSPVGTFVKTIAGKLHAGRSSSDLAPVVGISRAGVDSLVLTMADGREYRVSKHDLGL